MGKYDKKYDAFQIFEEIQGMQETSQGKQKDEFQPEKITLAAQQPEKMISGVRDDDMYYEIEYDSCPMPGVGKFVLKSQKIEAPVKDEIRELFTQMRNIARDKRSYDLYHSRFYDKRVQRENAQIFYKQAMFMKDFEDDYEKVVLYSDYYPCYQMMGYEQLRTYFTWRTQVRNGGIEFYDSCFQKRFM